MVKLIVLQISLACTSNPSKTDISFYEGQPTANVKLLVAEVENGGFQQYFSNSSGVNCFETMRSLEKSGKTQTAQILQQAINLINPSNLPEGQLIENIRRREVNGLDDQTVNKGLSRLDSLFYTEPDGPLIP